MTRPTTRRRRAGFTLIELLVVIVIIAILIALLLPAIAAAVRRANDARVTAEINVLATAMADFKSKYGDYPPSRIILREDGIYDTACSTPLVNVPFFTVGTQGDGGNTDIFAANDLTYGQLCQRSVRYLTKFWPRLRLSITQSSTVSPAATPVYDFDGLATTTATGPRYLQGHECLVFFLGGIPTAGTNIIYPNGMSPPNAAPPAPSGFAMNPQNPFQNTAQASNRTAPLMEFNNARLIDDDGDLMWGYVDPLNSGTNARYYAYFASYGNGGYDPNDTNLSVTLGSLTPTSDVTTDSTMVANFFLFQTIYYTPPTASPAPNPYTSSLPYLAIGTTYVNNESYQIISAGRDGLYGPGGQYSQGNTTTHVPLPAPLPAAFSPHTFDRQSEADNLSNFATGTVD